MIISRFTKTPSEHATVVLFSEGESSKINIARTPKGDLQIQATNTTHDFYVTLNKSDEAELLSKLRFA